MKRGAIPFIKKTLIVMPLLRHWVLDFLNRRQTTELVSAGNTTHIICKKKLFSAHVCNPSIILCFLVFWVRVLPAGFCSFGHLGCLLVILCCVRSGQAFGGGGDHGYRSQVKVSSGSDPLCPCKKNQRSDPIVLRRHTKKTILHHRAR
jgi:hypothetical protein